MKLSELIKRLEWWRNRVGGEVDIYVEDTTEWPRSELPQPVKDVRQLEDGPIVLTFKKKDLQ